MISAKVIADSVSPQGHRLTTFELRYPKFIHGEFMTHRTFSRNASSSRAIPTAKYLEEVRSLDHCAAPLSWGTNQKGMQAGAELTGDALRQVQALWTGAAYGAAALAEEMAQIGAHKQVVNRILEPFIHINVVVTATEYANFFGLRLDAGADPTMRALAEAMWAAYSGSVPKLLKPGEWHLPYVTDEENDQLASNMGTFRQLTIKVSVARCARVSYKSFETGKTSTIDEDLVLYQRLLGAQPLHASPAEHQATPDYKVGGDDPASWEEWEHQDEWGNFVGWRQYRKMLPGEACAPLPEKYRGER